MGWSSWLFYGIPALVLLLIKKMRFAKLQSGLLEAIVAFTPWVYRYLRNTVRILSPPTMARRDRRLILIIDHDFPEPDNDAGSRAIFHFSKLLVDMGCDVVFWASSLRASLRGRAWLDMPGITCLSRLDTGELSAWASARPRLKFDSVVLSRPLIAAVYADEAISMTEGPSLLYGHDIHYERLRSMSDYISPGLIGRLQYFAMRHIERRLWLKMDCVLYPSQDEVLKVNEVRLANGRSPNAVVMPLWAAPEMSEPIPDIAMREGVLFVGSYSHAPNKYGLDWFLRNVLPLLRARGIRAVVRIMGAGMDAYVPPCADEQTYIFGWQSDHSLKKWYESSRVVIAPLCFGGGVKGKVLEALANGVPCVMTRAGAQGLPEPELVADPTDDPAAFAAQIDRLLSDDAYWVSRSQSARQYVVEHYSAASVKDLVRRLIDFPSVN